MFCDDRCIATFLILFPYRIVQAFVGTTVDYKSLYFCSTSTSQTSLCLVFDEKNIQWILKHASLQSSAFRSFARLFATKLGFSLSSLAFYFLETRLAKKQIDGRKTNRQPDTAREAKLTFRIRFHKTK